jgi:hypothetical protein
MNVEGIRNWELGIWQFIHFATPPLSHSPVRKFLVKYLHHTG